MGYSRKNANRRSWGYGISKGIKEISMWNFQGLIKNDVEFPRLTKKKNVEFPMVFVFSLGISKGSNTILWKIPGAFSKKYILSSTPPCLHFFWNRPMFLYDDIIMTFKQRLDVFLSWKCYKCSVVWCISNRDIAAIWVLSV